MNFRKLLRYLIQTLLFKISFQQHIYDETCKHTLSNKTNTETVMFASQLYHANNRFYNIYVNFCGRIGNIDPECDENSQVCILRLHRNKKKNFLNKVVTGFKGVMEFNNDTQSVVYSLTANTAATCDGDPYEFVVILDKKIESSTISSGDLCNLELRIPHPSVLLRPCEYSYNGVLINMKALSQLSETYVYMNSTKVALAICHGAESCKSNANICEIGQNGNQFDVATAQHIIYDDRSNLITVRGRKSANKLKSEIIVKCNWTATFDNPVKLAAKYKYSLDSKYGCVRIPFKCDIIDIEHYRYFLSSLNRVNGWRVANVNFGSLTINVCGALKHTTKNECSEKFSQVCLQSGNRYISYGALHTGFHFDGKTITLTYTHGSQCSINPKEYLNTVINFECSPIEKGPSFSSINNCTMYINWLTPSACPYDIAEDSYFSLKSLQHQIKETDDLDCNVLFNGQMFRLGSLKAKDSIVVPSKMKPGLKYYINICRPISLTSNNYLCKITGACIEDINEIDIRKKFIRIGTITKPQFEQDNLVIHYYGGYCSNSSINKYEVIINFNCSTIETPLKLKSETLCKVEFLWNTPLACKNKRPRNINCRSKSQSGDILDLSEMGIREFDINFNNNNYKVDICSDSIILSSNSTIVANDHSIIKGHRQFFETNCNYSIQYTFENSTTCNNKSDINMLKVFLLCNDITNNPDHIANYTRNDCLLDINLKSAMLCRHIQQCKEYPKIQEIKPSPTHVYHYEEMTAQTCSIHSNNNEILINDLPEINITVGGNNYSINTHQCNGFVCKNNLTLATLEVCHNNELDAENRMVNVNLLGPSCANGFYNVKLQLKCSPDDAPTIVVPSQEIKECSMLFILSLKKTCLLFNEELLDKSKDTGNNTGWIVGSTILVIGLLLISSVLYYKRKRNECSDISLRRRLLYWKNGSV